jgi:hypothetical protein
MSDLKRKAIEVKRKHEKAWMSLDGVTAVGIGLHALQPAVIVSVHKNSEAIRKKIPEITEGVAIIIQDTGEFNAH